MVGYNNGSPSTLHVKLINTVDLKDVLHVIWMISHKIW